MSQFGKNFDRAQRHYDNLEDTRGFEPDYDCDLGGHIRTTGIPISDDGFHTCFYCGCAFDEWLEKKKFNQKSPWLG